MSVLVNKSSKVIVQGFTGSEGTFHATQMIEYGTNVVGGVTPVKEALLIWIVRSSTQLQMLSKTGADVSIVLFRRHLQRMQSWKLPMQGIRLIVTITEGIPTKDMIMVKEYLRDKDTRLIGPNCPG